MSSVTNATSLADTTNGAVNGTLSHTTVAFTPVANDLLIVVLEYDASTNTANFTHSVSSSAGTTFYEAGHKDNQAANKRTVWFVAQALSSATSQTITGNCTASGGDNAGGMIIDVERVAGVTLLGASAVRQFNSSSGGSGTPAPAFGSAALTTNVCMGSVANNSNPATMTQPSGWSETVDSGFSTPTTGLEVAYIASGFTGTTVTWGSSSPGPYAACIIELDTSLAAIHGTLAQTLGGVVSSATGALAIQASAADTLDAVTSSATGALAIKAAAADTLADVAVAATGALAIQATAADTLDAVTSAATGTVAIQANVGITLDPATSNATGAVAVQGMVSEQLGDVTTQATGALAIQASAAQTLGDASVIATGVHIVPSIPTIITVPAAVSQLTCGAVPSKFTVPAVPSRLTVGAVPSILTVPEAVSTIAIRSR